MNDRAILLCTLLCGLLAVPQQPPASPTFRLYFLGHEVGSESSVTPTTYELRFVERGTEVKLNGSLEFNADGAPVHFKVEGRNYRLFASDSEVDIADGRARVRDAKAALDVELGGRPFFPIDNYGPIGIQEQLIKYWIARGRPAEIAAAPSGPVRITRRAQESVGAATHVERLSIEGVVWGTETAWFDVEHQQLVAVTTWAGALPFEAVRSGYESHKDAFISSAIRDRIDDLKNLTTSLTPIATNTFALVGGRVIQGTEQPPIERGTIIVRDGRIAAVGSQTSTPVPSGVPTIDVTGKSVIAGLWDSHAHASQTDWAPVYLASGVTTIRDMGGEEPFLIAMRDAIASGAALGPRYLLAGLIDGPGARAFGMVSVSTPDEARAIVRRYHDEGFQEIKIYIETPAALVPDIAAEAHRLGMTVTGHLPAGLTWQTAVEKGYDGIAHMQLRGTPDTDASRQQIAFFKEHRTVMDPTLSWNELSGRAMTQPLDALLPGASRLPLSLRRMFDSMTGGNGGSQANAAKLIKAAVDAGLLVMAGTDKGVPGFSLQRELEIYVQGGLTPLEAIRTSTIMPARAMKLDKELGTLEAGKLADLVVLDADPLANISNVRSARMVAAGGRLYDCDVLWKVAGFAAR
jgi:imidazolonepropionase-like amidohydrolase